MNRAYRTTLLMSIITAVAAGAAASVYPWPEPVVVSEAVGKPLFEEFSTSSVRSIRISTYNSDRNEVEQLLVRRKGEKWYLPTYKNYVADNGSQLGAAVNLPLDKTVLEKRSDNQEDHIKYGVVDPADVNTTVNRSSLGKKISLSDRNNKEIASLIVGLPVKNDPKRLKHYVRIPGQPSVYVVDLDPGAINPDFRAWVNPNLLKLTRTTQLKEVTVENYRLDPAVISEADRETIYQSRVIVGEKEIAVRLNVSNDSGKLAKFEMTSEQQQAIRSAAGSVTGIVFADVVPKNELVTKFLRNPNSKTKKLVFESLKEHGFCVADFENEAWQFDASGGAVTVKTGDGVIVSIYVGAIDSQPRNSSLKLNHYLMLVAGFDETLLPEPLKDPVEKDQKIYLRKIAERARLLKIGRQRAAELNESYSKWFYIVSEDVVAALRPELKLDAS